jgi:polysaccharide biosynthesis protein PslH
VRILLLTQLVPYPPDSGPKIKTYNVLRYLAQRHEVHLVSFVRSVSERANVEHLRRLCDGVTTVPLQRSRAKDMAALARSLATGTPFLIERDDVPAMRSTVLALLDRHRFDAVHADQLSMAQFAVDVPVSHRILDEHNAVWALVQRAARHESPGPRRVLAEVEWRKLRAYEGQVCRRFDRITVVSAEDRLALEAAAGARLTVSTIPIGVDSQELAWAPRTEEARHILSLATMFYPPNAEGLRWFTTEVFPSVRRAVPGTRLLVVGSRPPRSITRLGRPGTDVVVSGYVADLAPVLQQSAALIVPLHSGSGMRVKILEAFARGIPVVSTRLGAEGIQARDGEHLLLADEPNEFARALTRILCDPNEGMRLTRAARALVESRYDWRTALSGLDAVYPSQGAVG